MLMRQAAEATNNQMHSDSKMRSSFVAPLIVVDDVKR